MKCKMCGAEIDGSEKFCGNCGAPVGGEETPEVTEQFTDSFPPPTDDLDDQTRTLAFAPEEGPAQKPEKPKRHTGLIIGVAAAIVIGVGAGVFAFTRLMAKDPKEVVIAAFENIYTEGQTNPVEELFGWSKFKENVSSSDVESSITMILESCSEPEINEFAGSGLRITGKNDRTNQKGYANIGVIYKDMDLANLDLYYGDQTLMAAVPEISTRVFSLDLSEGLAERIQNSPVIGPALEMAGVDVEGIADYSKEIMDQAASKETNVLDFETLMTRYREGSKAKEKFKEALTVEKGEKDTFTIDGKEQKCRGYQVVVSKDSMVSFMEETSDFFLNDQELKDQYLSQLERTVKMAELISGESYYGMSATDLYTESIDRMTEAVDEMIKFLDETLTDVEMTVHVDKKGRLAAVNGSTVLMANDREVDTEFEFRFLGGSYLTENMTAEVSMGDKDLQMEISMEKEGTYDGKKLTSDVDMDLKLRGDEKLDAGATWTGTYDSEEGDYHMGLTVTGDGTKVVDVSMTGAVEELVKGSSITVDMEELNVSLMGNGNKISFSGEYSYEPLGEEITELKGETFDVLAADEDEWQSVFMEIYLGAMSLMGQISL